MKSVKRMTSDTMNEFAEKIEYGKENFITMLPFVKTPLHDFDRYKYYSDKGIFLIDYIGSEYCLYHLYHLDEGDDTLRASLILPSNWDKRFEIIEKSIPNIKQWFLQEDNSGKFIIQSLEYGEIEYYPTLSHYLIPTIIRNGFEPIYRMYMKRDMGQPVPQPGDMDKGLSEIGYSSNILNNIINYYFADESAWAHRYFVNCSNEELTEIFKQDFSIRNSKFIATDDGNIVSGIIISRDMGKVWIDNFSVSPEYDNSNIGEYILGRTIMNLSSVCQDKNIYIYLNRDCHDAISVCEKNGFVPFEFWTDMILQR